MSYEVQYIRSGEAEFVKRSFEEFATARAFATERKKSCDIVIFTETKVIEISIKTKIDASFTSPR